MFLLFKNSSKKVFKSFGRFVSLLLIVALGVAFFAGIRSSSPDIIDSLDHYYDTYNLMDFKITSTKGLTDDDVTALSGLRNVNEVEASYSLDVISEGEPIRIHSITKTINKTTLISGRMPETKAECLADDKYYNVGDTVQVSDRDGILAERVFTVTGTITSVLYLAKEYGVSTVGNGKLHSYIYVSEDAFATDYYTSVYITAKDAADETVYSEAYEEKFQLLKNELTSLKPIRETIRYEELQKEITEQILVLERQRDGYKQAMEKELTLLQERIGKGETYLQEEYDALWIQYSSQVSEFNIEIEKIRAILDGLEKPVWYLLDRSNINGYINLKEDTDKVILIANVLPIFFMLVVAFMALNTLTRMIEEERGEIGTLAALGYSNFKIMLMYILYSIFATLFGIVLGFFLGSFALPKIIYSVYASNYNLPALIISYNLSMIGIILSVSMALMIGVTVVACLKELRSNPAVLLVPPVPKKGKRIFLERVQFLWKRLSFTWKVTIRNIFRYKKRVFMTLIGISGCTALLLTGFGIRDSVDRIADKQYSEVFMYDDIIYLNQEAQSMSTEFSDFLEENDVVNPALVYQNTYTFSYQEKELETYVMVPEKEEAFYPYVALTNQKGEAVQLKENGAIITEKMARLLKVNVGDTISIRDSDNVLYIIEVSDIVENYIYHYIYMSKTYYEKIFDRAASYNIVISDNESTNEAKLAEVLMQNSRVSLVNFTTDNLETFNELVSGLTRIIFMIIIIAAILALIVLYNLTMINISERTREIATLKVLGFYDRDVGDYIYRETVLLTMLGALIGLGLGVLLHQFVIRTIEIENTVFIKLIQPLSYGYSFLILLLFTIVIAFVSHFKLRKVDMISSLKSVD
ncbi:MAG: ABC transporter permease [Christensenellaceae bacterium]|jgi:putative ABC transport system permease protein